LKSPGPCGSRCQGPGARRAQAEPKRLGRRGKGPDGRGDQWPDARHRYQAACHLILLGLTGDVGIELADLGLQVNQRRDQNLERGDGIGR